MVADFLIYASLIVISSLLGFLLFYVWRWKKGLDLFFNAGSQDLKEFLKEESQRLKRQEEEIEKIVARLDKLEKISEISIQKVGLVRFNPFHDTGGDQSFSVALLDSQDSGFVITSLYGRDGNRVYAKPIKYAESEYSLSQEEKRAIQKARGS